MARSRGWNELDRTNWEELQVIWNLWKTFVNVFEQTRKRDYLDVYDKLDDEKKQKVVKLICLVKGQKIEEEKVVEDFEITVDDIDLVLERARRLRPKLFVENVNE